ncbi:MAG TPA: DNA polymerase III subunit delta' [Bacteroidetes bacterium]|nr:DNA polymerase III subunit delta' [Bacteroidota bacterium]
MQFKFIIGQEEVKNKLLNSFNKNRVGHTQLFLGPEGNGSLALAIAFAQYINCKNRTETDSCGTCPSCIKYQHLAHPDLHFFFPTTTNDKVKKDPKSELFLDEWREYLKKLNGYPTQKGWYGHLGVGNKQGTIYVRDAGDFIRHLALKAFESEYRIFIVWMAEKLHSSASNKLLKTFEEPPDKTLIFLIAERYELLLPTVRSRAQLVKVPKISDKNIEQALIHQKGLPENQAAGIAMQAGGNWNLAVEIAENIEDAQTNFIKFRDWLRLCFKPGNFLELNNFNSELSRIGREKVKSFLTYGLETIHNSILINSGHDNFLRKSGDEAEFTKRFAPYINQANQKEVYELLNEAIYHIERNAHAGILLSDLSFKIYSLLKKGLQNMKKK